MATIAEKNDVLPFFIGRILLRRNRFHRGLADSQAPCCLFLSSKFSGYRVRTKMARENRQEISGRIALPQAHLFSISGISTLSLPE
jgi:hypothetical protein